MRRSWASPPSNTSAAGPDELSTVTSVARRWASVSADSPATPAPRTSDRSRVTWAPWAASRPMPLHRSTTRRERWASPPRICTPSPAPGCGDWSPETRARSTSNRPSRITTPDERPPEMERSVSRASEPSSWTPPKSPAPSTVTRFRVAWEPTMPSPARSALRLRTSVPSTWAESPARSPYSWPTSVTPERCRRPRAT
jgi:hypothetical protein